MEWDFLEETVRMMGFNEGWIGLVMGCVTTISFSVVINGKPENTFILLEGEDKETLYPYIFSY